MKTITLEQALKKFVIPTQKIDEEIRRAIKKENWMDYTEKVKGGVSHD